MAFFLEFNRLNFYNKVSNKIIAVPKGNTQYRWSMMNVGLVEDKGCDKEEKNVRIVRLSDCSIVPPERPSN